MSAPSRRVRRPIIVLGFARSGTTMLEEIVRTHPDVAFLTEPRTIWMTGHAYQGHDELGAADLTPRIARRIDESFARFLAERGRPRFAEKTPSNCLRVPFVHALYPDCRIVHVLRDGRDVVRSLLQEQQGMPYKGSIRKRLKETPLAELPALVPLAVRTVWRTQVLKRPPSWWGPQPRGWKAWRDLPQHVRAARQWVACVEAALRDGRALPSENYLELRYEAFVSDPVPFVEKVVEFAGLEPDAALLEFAADKVDPGRKGRWRHTTDSQMEQEIEREVGPLLERLGYLEPPDRDEPLAGPIR